MVSKFDTGNIKWCIYGITYLEITYVSVKCKPLQGESGKAIIPTVERLISYFFHCSQHANIGTNVL